MMAGIINLVFQVIVTR